MFLRRDRTTPPQNRCFIRIVLAFGTHNDVIPGIDTWIKTQWDNVWPKTADFRFVHEQTSVLASPTANGDRDRAVDQHRL